MKNLLKCMILALGVLLHPGFAQAETCEYNTNWGVLTLGTHGNQANGYWPQGTVSGSFNYPYINGQWAMDQGGQYGQFSFTLYNGGFNGVYKLANDYNWRGNWSGTLIRCY